MATPARSTQVLRFGPFELDAAKSELRKAGIPLKIHPQPFRILLLLLERPGKVIRREEIQRSLWGHHTWVDFEGGINACIRQIRSVLGDDAEAPRYIETVPRRGYRFIFPLTHEPINQVIRSSPASVTLQPVSDQQQTNDCSSPASLIHSLTRAAHSIPESSRESFFSFLEKPSQLLRSISMAAAAIGLVALGVLLYERPWARVQLPKQVIERDLTANSTENPVGGAAISPDGRQLAYSDGKNGLTLLQIDSGEKRVLLPNGLPPLDWYPDGTHLLVGGRVPGGLYRVSTLDGSSQRLLSESDEVSAVSVSPDGMHIAFVKASAWSDLWVMGPDGGRSKRIRTMSSSPNSMISEVAWSPTSQRILYSWEELATQEGKFQATIASCAVDGDHEVVMLSDGRLRNREGDVPLSWSPDGRVFFHLQEPPPNERDTNFWAVKADPDTGRLVGKLSRVTNNLGFTDGGFSQSADGKRLIFQKVFERDNIMVAEFKKPRGELERSQPIGDDNWHRQAPQWTSDSENLIFVSNPQGSSGIFRLNIRTQQIRKLVAGNTFSVANVGPVPTFDGKWLLYNGPSGEEWPAGVVMLMRMPLDGGPATPVLTGRFSYQCASAANVCVLSELSPNQRTFSLLDPVIGRGPVIGHVDVPRISPDYGWSLAPNGKCIAFIPQTEGPNIDIISVDGKISPQRITVSGARFQSLTWSSDNDGFYVTDHTDAGWEILAVSFDGTYRRLLAPNDDSWIVAPRPSPDGRFLAYQQRTFHVNIAMLENY